MIPCCAFCEDEATTVRLVTGTFVRDTTWMEEVLVRRAHDRHILPMHDGWIAQVEVPVCVAHQ